MRLLYRRAPVALQDWKGWNLEDIVMARQTLFLPDQDGTPRTLVSDSRTKEAPR